MLKEGEVFAGFTIERLLGRGGMGAVYLAKHPRLPRLTALKLLSRDLYGDTEVLARFEREADLASRLSHPGIVAVYDRGVEDGQPWISMQYIDGVDADSITPETFSTEQVIDVVAAAADALDYAHGVGILHRDIKPANILLARRTREQREGVLLTDFGIARLQEGTALTRTGTVIATLPYASPEQLSNLPVDHRADQYSLACTLFRLLTGTGAFPATDPLALIKAHLYDAPTSVRHIRPDLPRDLDAVLRRALAKRADDRFATCTEFIDAARQALTPPVRTPPRPEPITPQAARPDPPPPEIRRFGSRRARIGWISAAAVLAAAALIANNVANRGTAGSTPDRDPATAAAIAISREFPGVAPPPKNVDLGVGTGFRGVTCYVSGGESGSFAGAVAGWRCASGSELGEYYHLLAYNSVTDVRTIIGKLGYNTTRLEAVNSNGTMYTNYLFDNEKLVTVFEGDPDRENVLMLSYFAGYLRDKSTKEEDRLMEWWKTVPLDKPTTATSTEPPR